MPTALQRHPESQGGEGLRIEVEVGWNGAALSLRYQVAGPVENVRFPPPATPERVDGLWRTTCFEAFVRAGAGEGYYEFNFAPSGSWAAYRFDGPRSGMAALEIPPPRIEAREAEGRYQLSAVLDPPAGLPHDAPWRLALSAVIEGADGRRSFWALAHPSAQPDFHHPDSFRLSLPPSARP